MISNFIIEKLSIKKRIFISIIKLNEFILLDIKSKKRKIVGN